jgi:hypothetical protein
LNELLGARLPQTMTGRKSGPGTEARMPGRARRPVSCELTEADRLGPRGWAVEARSPKPATLKRRPLSAHCALAEAGEEPEACLEDWRRAGEEAEAVASLLLALTRLTPELSRAAKRRRLERIVRPASDASQSSASGRRRPVTISTKTEVHKPRTEIVKSGSQEAKAAAEAAKAGMKAKRTQSSQWSALMPFCRISRAAGTRRSRHPT